MPVCSLTIPKFRNKSSGNSYGDKAILFKRRFLTTTSLGTFINSILKIFLIRIKTILFSFRCCHHKYSFIFMKKRKLYISSRVMQNINKRKMNE